MLYRTALGGTFENLKSYVYKFRVMADIAVLYATCLTLEEASILQVLLLLILFLNCVSEKVDHRTESEQPWHRDIAEEDMIQDRRKDSIGRSHYNTKRSQER
jgi:hypothetical protein